MDRITIMDPSVALPSEDLAEETVTEQESAPEEQKDQEDQEAYEGIPFSIPPGTSWITEQLCRVPFR